MKSKLLRVGVLWVMPCLFTSSVTAQPPAIPASPPTIWSFLGIPQGARKVTGALVNRRGNLPGMEKAPPIKALADPANLMSDVPVIKKAAEVKMAEDLKKQKIKGIKYLTKIGCGCYDLDGEITKALIASAQDCTEEVRLATVEAIAEAAEGSCCSNCGKFCCCNEDVLKQLAKMAYERDEKGCYLEPSARVREAAARALRICCPNEEPVAEEIPLTNPEPTPERVPESVPTPEEAPEGAEGSVKEGEAEASDAQVTVPATPTDVAADEAADQTVSLSPIGETEVADEAEIRASIDGVIMHLDAQRGLAHVHLENRHANVAVGSMMYAVRPTPQGLRVLGRLLVYQAHEGSVNVREVDAGLFSRLEQGSLVMAGEQQAEPTVEPQNEAQPVEEAVAAQSIESPSAPLDAQEVQVEIKKALEAVSATPENFATDAARAEETPVAVSEPMEPVVTKPAAPAKQTVERNRSVTMSQVVRKATPAQKVSAAKEPTAAKTTPAKAVSRRNALFNIVR